jgi:cytochrome c biogenesis protein CcmG, thiol:disulfide interchange protein DsbE
VSVSPPSAEDSAPSSEATPKRRWPHWSTLLAIGVLLWAAPRLLPHLGAVAGIRSAGARTPQFSVRTLTGETLSSAALRGQVVLVNVWATWCTPCRVEMPMLESTWQRHRAAGLVVLGASVDRAGESVVRDYVTSRGVTYPVAVVGGDVIAALGGVRGYPTSILIGRNGVVRHVVLGPIGPVTLEPAIRRALADTAR